jgi:MFS family permease
MVLSFSLMGGSVLFLALIPSYAAIGPAAPVLAVLARLVQGFALGGEVGPNLAYLAEAAPAHRRGLAVCLQGVSQQVAALAGALVGLLLSLALPHAALETYGWRIAFLLGALTLPVGLVLRGALHETLHRPDMAAATAHAGRSAPAQTKIVVLCFLALSNATIATYMQNYMTTFAQNALHLGSQIAFAASALPSATAIGGGLLGGWLSDRIGRKPVMIGALLAFSLATLPLFHWIVSARTPAALLGGSVLLALLSTPAWGALYGAMTELTPKASRGRSVALIYALAIGLFGGTAQLVVTGLIHVTGDLMAPGWYLLAADLVGLGAVTLLPESAPVKLAQMA